ncbi:MULTISPECIES: ABC transporter ATP-binding protein [Curtobacterium]|uniref:ABC transporter ATP-binding protein n=2 Tax=Curtobacterium citreum TaxID=2036 RepID=A0ABT2HGH3_9MICO|nr:MULTISPECIES: ABC transporter ATP-binding protein [Curtobacterium]MCS6522370.1 ABC transporter ATP-binding protein [Curtobacterium citreum]
MVLELQSVWLRGRGRARPRIHDASIQLEAGRVYGLIGPNGAGKSSLLAVLAGLVRPDRGTVRDVPWQRGEPIGAVFGDVDMHRGRTVRETLLLRSRLVGRTPDEAESMAVRVGLGAVLRRRVAALSLGMRMRLSIGVALLGSPMLVLLDEPMNGLDPDGIAWMRGVVSDLRQAGATVVVSSHLLGELETMIDDAIIVSRGEIVCVESIADTAARGCDIEVDEPARLLAAMSDRGVPATMRGRVVHVEGTAPDTVRVAVSIGLDVTRVGVSGRVLESLYGEVASAEFESEGAR